MPPVQSGIFLDYKELTAQKPCSNDEAPSQLKPLSNEIKTFR